MPDIENIHANFFEKVFAEIANTTTFLKVALPAALRHRLDLTQLTLDPTSYISPAYKRAFSDLVVKCRTSAGELPVDIYFLFEHKSFQDSGVLLQLLRYMDLRWQQDSVDKKPLRVIIPLVFYHGAGAWRIPTQLETMLKETKLKGEVVMPSTAQRLRNEGMQQALVTLLTTRFQLNENEKQLIGKIDELEQLTAALKLVVTAQTKEEILESLTAAVH